MANWTHNVCERCWFGSPRGLLPDGRFRMPTQIRYPDEDRTGDICCVCGTPTVSGIYVREDAEELLCKGNHESPDQWSPFITGKM